MHFDTRLVRAGQDAEPGTGDVVPPIHIATTYERRVQPEPTYFYARGENPTREGLESCLAALEDAPHAAVFSSGQAAAATVLSLLAPGRTVVAMDDLYSGTDALLEMAVQRGVRVRYAPLHDAAAATDALDEPDLAMVWVETPSNPLLRIVDIAALAGPAHDRGALLVVDNTFASPALQQPLALGADVSLYSTTKFVAGHGDVLGGALVYRDGELDHAIRAYRTAAGNVPGALDCYLVHRGVKTLALRMARQVRTAGLLARLLTGLPGVGDVYYPGLPGHAGQKVAARQMSAPGALLSFEYTDGPAEQLLDRFRLFSCAVSLGGVQSLVECPALMTHRPLPPKVRRARGISDGLIRISAGIEDPDDLAQDLAQAVRGSAPASAQRRT
jgi:cystathionine beta-lyase/cystathionine gamma-synthase